MMKQRNTIILLLAVFIITGWSCRRSQTRLTYLEYNVKNDFYDSTAELSSTGEYLTQSFRADYDLLHGFRIRMDTFGRDNNSFWNIALVDPENSKVLYEKTYNASHFPDKKDYLIEFERNIPVQQDHIYQIRISARNADADNAVAFYKLTGGQDNELSMCVNGQNTADRLYLSVYGGNRSIWWMLYSLFFGFVAFLIVLRFFLITRKGLSWRDDKLLHALLLGAAVFILLKTFSIRDGFTDENDNMLGGLVIAHGKVLYRDYVTQHMPLGYYLCAVFAKLGAKSAEQFRLLYYLTTASLWSVVYLRFSDQIGRRKAFILPIAETVLVSSLYAPHATMILADNIHGLLLTVLLLEFLIYYKDRDLGWRRSVSVSLCIWGCIGAAFISVYSILWIALAVLAIEIHDSCKSARALREIFTRYYKLILAVTIPPAAAVLYFYMHHALKEGYRQAYLFNRELFPEYLGSMGGSPLEPIIQMFQNMFAFIDGSVQQILTSQANREILPQLIIILTAMSVLAVALYSKRYIESLLLFTVLCSTAVRGLDSIHGMPAWYVSVMIIIVMTDAPLRELSEGEGGDPKLRRGKLRIAAVSAAAVYLCSFYVSLAGENLMSKPKSISELQRIIIAETEYGDPIMVDAYRQEPLYFLYRGRELANKTAYMLPWYMDWFEQDTIAEIAEIKPRAVVFKEDRETWGYTNYARGVAKELKKSYHRLSDDPDDGWMYSVWLPNSEE